MNYSKLPRRSWAAVELAAIILIAACGGGNHAGPVLIGGNEPTAIGGISDIQTLSNRADMISGDDALVEVILKDGTNAPDVKVSLNGADVTSSFAVREDGKFKGLVTGLKPGANRLSANMTSGPAMVLDVTNFPIGGPIFSGPQLTPWQCETERAGLAKSNDAQCNVAKKIDYVYRSTDTTKTAFLPYDVANRPSDVATITVDNGETVPYIVRREVGTTNRGVYTFAVVASPEEAITPFKRAKAWNGALHWELLGGALPQLRSGPLVLPLAGISGVYLTQDIALVDAQLRRGYVTASSSLTAFGQNTNSVVSAETIMMVKEHIAETFGQIDYVVAFGVSGGSIQANQLINQYPGIFDGISTGLTFADVHSTNAEVQDCSLLVRYFDSTSPSMWADKAQQTAVLGNANLAPGTCRAWVTDNGLDRAWMDPASKASLYDAPTLWMNSPPPPQQPWMWDRLSNPTGVRATLQDYQRNIFGLRPDGYANRPYDNLGVQYGLTALRQGTITPDQFIDMNEKVGGRDINFGWTPKRSEADPIALARVYRSGQYNLLHHAGATPIIDNRGGCDNTEIHSCYNSYKVRERLRAYGGSSANHVLLLNKPGDSSHLDMLTSWMNAIRADKTTDSAVLKATRAKPKAAVDACWINSVRVTDAGACAAAFPSFGNPRMSAGAPLQDPALKCQLVPLSRASYVLPLTDAQWARLQVVFPDGVCDWSQPGVSEDAAVPWLSYAKGPGGEPFAKAPAAHQE